MFLGWLEFSIFYDKSHKQNNCIVNFRVSKIFIYRDILSYDLHPLFSIKFQKYSSNLGK